MAKNIYLDLWNKRMQLKKVTLLDEDVIYGINDFLAEYENDTDKWTACSISPFGGEEDSVIWHENLWSPIKENHPKPRKETSLSFPSEEVDLLTDDAELPYRRRRMEQWKSKLDEVAARRKRQRENDACTSSVKPQKSLKEIWRKKITDEQSLVLDSAPNLTDSSEVTNAEPDLSWSQIQKMLLKRPDYSECLYWPSKESPIKGLLDEYEEPLWWHDEKTRMEGTVFQHRVLIHDDEDYLMPAGREENGVRFYLASELQRARRRLPHSSTEIALRPSRKRTRFPAPPPETADKCSGVVCVVQRDRHTSTTDLLQQ